MHASDEAQQACPLCLMCASHCAVVSLQALCIHSSSHREFSMTSFPVSFSVVHIMHVVVAVCSHELACAALLLFIFVDY